MARQQTIGGCLSQYDVPEWGPLVDLVGDELASWFMWMHEIQLDGGARVHAYKHISTRRYLHLALDGRAFAYTEHGRYRAISPREAIDAAFVNWDVLLPSPEDPDAVRAALRAAHERA